MSNIVLTFQYLQYDAYPRFTITLQVKSKRTLGSLEVKMDAITIGSYLVCTNAPQVKTPPESAPRIRATGALHCVQPTHKRGRKSILVTDGAPCYPKLTSEHSLLHEACNHSKGIFCITKKKEWGNLLVHPGGIDGMWKISKGAVSSSWSTRKDGVVNPQLLQGIRVWQWRWHHGNSTDFCSLTGKALSKRLEK